MADTVCPACSSDITPDDINMREGAAFCRACDKMWRVSDLAGPPSLHTHTHTHAASDDDAEEASADQLAAREPPRGCWIRDEGTQTRVGARCRSATGFFFLLFATFWNSITWLFVFLALSGSMPSPTSQHINPHPIPTPAETAPQPPTSPSEPLNVEAATPTSSTSPAPSPAPPATPPAAPPAELHSATTAGSGIEWFLLLFMIPFVLIGLVTASLAILGLFGRCEVTLRNHAGEAFTGVGPPSLHLGWTRRFSADLVRAVNIRNSNSSTNGKPNKHIVIVADNDVPLGLFLSPDRRRWLAGALRSLLNPSPATKRR